MRSPTAVVALGSALVLGALSGLHVFWALGGRWGGAAAVPTRAGGTALFVPSAAATLGVAAALALAAHLVVVRGGLARPLGPGWLYTAGTWTLGVVFAARVVGDFRYVGLFKRVRDTPFAGRDDRLYVPLCALLGGAALWLALHPASGTAGTTGRTTVTGGATSHPAE